ncbi:hypothetical protein ACHAXT_000228 [Thalassiosira profunda]
MALWRIPAATTCILALLAAFLTGASAFAPPPIASRISKAHNHHPSFLASTSSASTEVEVTVQREGDADGSPASAGDIISVKYAGRLASDGTQFDAGSISFKLGEGRVIKGWEQGLVGARRGEKRALRIPSALAYGSRGAGGVIPPNAELEFDCELLSVESGPIAELKMALGLGANLQTALLAAFVASVLLPVLGIGGVESGTS